MSEHEEPLRFRFSDRPITVRDMLLLAELNKVNDGRRPADEFWEVECELVSSRLLDPSQMPDFMHLTPEEALPHLQRLGVTFDRAVLLESLGRTLSMSDTPLDPTQSQSETSNVDAL